MEWLHGVEDRRKRARRASDAEREWIAEEIRKAIEGEQRHEWRAVEEYKERNSDYGAELWWAAETCTNHGLWRGGVR